MTSDGNGSEEELMFRIDVAELKEGRQGDARLMMTSA